MNDYLNKWIWLDLLYYKDDFQEINQLNLIHPLDVELFKANPTHTIYECIDFEGDYLVIRGMDCQYRVLPEAVKRIMPTPEFKWNDRVIQNSKPNINAVIDDFFWHHQREEYMYYILVNGKRKSNRYSENELTLQIK